MKTNFDINIPSIPGKNIKFKIQDIKTTAFGTQKTRFSDNKSHLTHKFIHSFHNFHQRKTDCNQENEQKDDIITQAQSDTEKYLGKRQSEHRYLIPDEKKYLLLQYDKFKNYEAPLQQTQFNRGYTFDKSNLHLDQASNKDLLQEKSSNKNVLEEKSSYHLTTFTNNYYFSIAPKNIIQQTLIQKKNIPFSSTFKNQPRNKVYARLNKNQIPGPGTYLHSEKRKSRKKKNTRSLSIQDNQNLFDYKGLKKIITNLIDDSKSTEVLKIEEENNQKTDLPLVNNHMFMLDDRDRFGNPKYPIAAKMNVPGPGSYEIKNSLEEKIRKVQLVEEQRKLLKQWFNDQV